MKLITTLNEIREHYPCEPSWIKLLKSLNKTKVDDEPLELMAILETLGIQDAVWCLRCFDYKNYCLFLADVVESVLPIYEKEYPDDNRVKDCIEGIKKYHTGKITEKELNTADAAAYAAADTAAYTAAYTAVATAAYAAAYAAAAAAYAAADAAADTADAAADTADTATYAADYAADYAAAYAAADTADTATYAADYARKEKWQEIEQLFIKHFKE